jgi:hypothetical protein
VTGSRSPFTLGLLGCFALLIVLIGLRGRHAEDLESRFRVHDPSPGEPVTNDNLQFALEALDLDLKDALAQVEKAFEREDARAVAECLTDTFRGSCFESVAPATGPVVEIESGESRLWTDGREAFAEALARFFDSFEDVYESFFKVAAYAEGEVFSRRLNAKVKQDLRGTRKDGSVHQEFVYWKCSFQKIDDSWKLDRAFILSRHQLVAPAPLFTEVTTAAGLSLSEPPELTLAGLGNIYVSDQTENFTNYDYGGVCLYDVDGDGDLDVFMANAYGPCALFMNQGDGSFADEAAERGIRTTGGSRGAVFGDADNDGDPDLFICRAPFHHPSIPLGSNLFFENLGGGRFVERTAAAGLTHVGASMTAVFLDYDRDGDLDLFVANYGTGKNRHAREHHPYNATDGAANLLYRNDGGLRFTDVSAESGIGRENHWSYAVSVCDWNKDGYPDVFVANDFGPDVFYLNQGDGTFREAARELGVDDIGNGMGSAFVDWDGDGDWDLYVTNMQSNTGQRVLAAASPLLDPVEKERLWKLTLGNSFFEWDAQGKFQPRAVELGVANCGWAWHGDFADFDADGDSDLLVANGYFTGIREKDC